MQATHDPIQRPVPWIAPWNLSAGRIRGPTSPLNANAAGWSRQRCAAWIRRGGFLRPVAPEWMSALIEAPDRSGIKMKWWAPPGGCMQAIVCKRSSVEKETARRLQLVAAEGYRKRHERPPQLFLISPPCGEGGWPKASRVGVKTTGSGVATPRPPLPGQRFALPGLGRPSDRERRKNARHHMR